MRILLANPYCLDPRLAEDDIRVPPIGLYYIGAALFQAGHQVELANWYDAGGLPRRIEQELTAAQPDIIGISVMNANRWGAVEIAEMAKRLFPGIPVVLGGPGATFLWEHLLEHFQQVDFVVCGEGEETFVELIQGLGSSLAPEVIKGLAYRVRGRPVRNPDRPFVQDLDSLPDPADHFSFQHVISSRGCPWNCAFCGSPAIWKRKVRFHSPSYFVDQLEKLSRKGQNFFFVSDDTFTLRRQRVIEICQEIVSRQLPITWQAISRVNHVDQEVLVWMRRAGCTQVSYGIESGAPEIRQRLGKELQNEEIRKAFSATTSAGMLPRAYFIYGSPGETDQTIEATVQLMDEIAPLAAIFYIMDLFPGTRLYDEYVQRSGVTDRIWLERIEDIMYFETTADMDKEKILEWGRRLRTHFFSRLPSYVSRIQLLDRPELRPLHADFLSRLAMTFAFGDYASNPQIPDREGTASKLFEKALEQWPDHRAFLGLAILEQKAGRHPKAIDMAEQGLKRFPDSLDLACCKAVSLMNLGSFKDALPLLMKHQDSPRALQYALQCAQALGDMGLYQEIAARLETLERTGT